MAERRMFAKTIIDSDAFLDMPLSAQALYFHLSMRADDDGFINNPKKIQRMVGASDDDCKLLIMKRFIILFDSGVIVIKHWKIHNYIQKDRYQPTIYQKEKNELVVKENKAYTECIQDVYSLDTQDRLGKDRLGNKEIECEKTPSETATAFPYDDYRTAFVECCPSLPKPQNVELWTNSRKKSLRAKRMSVEEFRDVCKKIERSDFLTGRDGKWNGCSLDWILKPANWQKIIEGNYDKHSKPTPDVKPSAPSSYDLSAYQKNAMSKPLEYRKK